MTNEITLKKALIIVDVQPDFCEGGALAVEGGNAVAEKIAKFVRNHKDSYEVIISTQDWHIDPGEHFSETPDYVDTWPIHCKAETPGAALHPDIADLPIDISIKKGQVQAAYSGFEGVSAHGVSLKQALFEHEVRQVDVVGIAESHCVKETAIDAAKLGFNVRVFSDLTVPVTEELGIAAREEMKEVGIEQMPSSVIA